VLHHLLQVQNQAQAEECSYRPC